MLISVEMGNRIRVLFLFLSDKLFIESFAFTRCPWSAACTKLEVPVIIQSAFNLTEIGNHLKGIPEEWQHFYVDQSIGRSYLNGQIK